jgi:hypothetical protein
MENSGNKYNRLINETSPYLLQHAGNPVDWYPWGEEAFARAARDDKPVFLSIGYSTCHWCHVMERESFEKDDVASLLNRAFVCVKVDREERPDVDRLYMEFCQALTGSGGWPLTIVMTPGKKPFFAATYIPPESRHGRTGLRELIPAIEKIWREQRGRVEDSAEKIAAALDASPPVNKRGPGPDMRAAFGVLAEGYDSLHGGFGGAPKFPMAHVLVFLARYWYATGDARARAMAEHTLEAMRRGGMYDHLGGGFHRYSTDAAWRLPHFEKMLHDQAMLALAYLEAGQAFANGAFSGTAREIFDYVLRDMTSPGGGFYSAEDADSEGEEGRYYLWRDDEIRAVLGDENARAFSATYGVTPEGNIRHEATGAYTGDNVLIIEGDDSHRGLRESGRALLEARLKRPRPLRDDKILADWNGLMIAALARGARVLGDARYADAALRATDFILADLRGGGGALLHCRRGDLPSVPAMADDYAFMIWGLIELYEATFQARFLGEALRLNREFIADFWDDAAGAFFSTGREYGRDLLFRRRELPDSALPSANSVAMLNLLRLARMTGEADLEEKALRIGGAYHPELVHHPTACAAMLSAKLFAEAPSCEIVFNGEPGTESLDTLLNEARRHYHPHAVLLLSGPRGSEADLAGMARGAEQYSAGEGGASARVCGNFTCRRPVSDPGDLSALLKEITGGDHGTEGLL